VIACWCTPNASDTEEHTSLRSQLARPTQKQDVKARSAISFGRREATVTAREQCEIAASRYRIACVERRDYADCGTIAFA
jgi:FtsZ-interacting cell division protein YlmF